MTRDKIEFFLGIKTDVPAGLSAPHQPISANHITALEIPHDQMVARIVELVDIQSGARRKTWSPLFSSRLNTWNLSLWASAISSAEVAILTSKSAILEKYHTAGIFKNYAGRTRKRDSPGVIGGASVARVFREKL